MKTMEMLSSQPLIMEAVKRGTVIAIGVLIVLSTVAWAFASLGEMQAERERRRFLQPPPADTDKEFSFSLTNTNCTDHTARHFAPLFSSHKKAK